jgi:CBS domain-containing protein
MTTVERILDSKGRQIFSCAPGDTVHAAVETMAKYGVGALVVVDAKGKLNGVVSERDLLHKVVLTERKSRELKVRDIMSSPRWTITPDQKIDDCMAMMTANRIRHLPVLQKNKLVGLISIGDVVKYLMNEKDFIINQLESYITAG